MSDPINPTRVIPAGEWPPLGPAPLPPRPPGPDDVPPWRAPAAPPSPPPPSVPLTTGRPWPEPPADGPLEIRVTVDLVAGPEPEPAPRRNWTWLWHWLRPRQSLIGITVALIPSPAYDHHSLTTGWADALNDLRADGLGAAYLMAGIAAGLAVLLDHRRQTWWARCLLVVTTLGGTGALGWYDPVTVLTGVRP